MLVDSRADLVVPLLKPKLSCRCDLCIIKDFCPCGRPNHILNDSRRLPQIIIGILLE